MVIREKIVFRLPDPSANGCRDFPDLDKISIARDE
jgi:hypothetical protein